MSEKQIQSEIQQSDFSKKKSAIFVQGISKHVKEYEIQELLNEIQIFCLKIPKDANRENYGYAIISFNNLKEAELAIKILRYKKFHKKTLRVSWFNRSIFREREKDSDFNIFIKNLNKTITHEELDQEFLKYGDIISSKIQEDEEGESLGYGFIQYYQKENVNKAIEEKNGKNWKEKKLYAGKLLRNKPKNLRFNNIFIRNISKEISEEKLLIFFGKFGEIGKYMIKSFDGTDELPKFSEEKIEKILQNKFAFVCYKEFEPAMNAVKAVPFMEIEDEENNGKLFLLVENLLDKGFNNWEEAFEKIEVIKRNGKEKYEEKMLMNVYEFADFLLKKSKGEDNINFEEKTQENFIVFLKEFHLYKKTLKENNDNFTLNSNSDSQNNSNKIFCSKMLKKKERLLHVKEIFEKNKIKLQKKYEYCNLYVKNLHKNISEDTFKQMFEKYGTLKSCKLSSKNFISSNSLFDKSESSFLYGFVCFENEKDALCAKKAWNRSFINASFRKPLYVDYHQNRKEREIILRNKRINFINRFIGKGNNNENRYNKSGGGHIDIHRPDVHMKMLTPDTKINFSYKSPICTLLQNSNGAYSVHQRNFLNNNYLAENSNKED